MIERLQKWWYRNDAIDKSFHVFIALVLVLGVLAIKGVMAEQKAFMEECLQDHKQYECTAMWRAGNTRTQTVPVIIN